MLGGRRRLCGGCVSVEAGGGCAWRIEWGGMDVMEVRTCGRVGGGDGGKGGGSRRDRLDKDRLAKVWAMTKEIGGPN